MQIHCKPFLPVSAAFSLLFLTGCLGQQKPLSEHEWKLVHEAEAYFNAKPLEKGEFVQTGNFRQGRGTFLFAPGRLCLRYTAPHGAFFFADSEKIIDLDQKTGARTSFKVSGTPFSNFLTFPIHLSSKTTHVEEVAERENGYDVTLVKRYKTRKITLKLDFSYKDQQSDLSGIDVFMAPYSFQAHFQNRERLKEMPNFHCLPER